MEKLTPRELIIKTLKEKSSLKQDVYANTLHAFNLFKSTAKQVAADLKKEAMAIDKRVIIDYKEKGAFEFELRVAGDLLIFNMHTNIFEFDKSHNIWKSSYVFRNMAKAKSRFKSVVNER